MRHIYRHQTIGRCWAGLSSTCFLLIVWVRWLYLQFRNFVKVRTLSWCYVLHLLLIVQQYWSVICSLFQDFDEYKTGTKDKIANWIELLKSHDIFDWLIVVVVNEETKVKSKILRTSVIDKVKNDFCSKTLDRYAMLQSYTYWLVLCVTCSLLSFALFNSSFVLRILLVFRWTDVRNL